MDFNSIVNAHAEAQARATEPVTHTPGPWEIRRAKQTDNTGGTDFAIVCPRDRVIIAEAFEHVDYADEGPGYNRQPAEANALLIAAAPDLLEALEVILKFEGHMAWCGHGADMSKPCVCGLNKAIERGRAAINRARGESTK